MEIKPWMKNLKAEDMPNEDLQNLAALGGVEIAVELLKLMPGISINIPQGGFKKLINEYIRQNYDGTRTSQIKLSLECGVTDKYVYRVCKKKRLK